VAAIVRQSGARRRRPFFVSTATPALTGTYRDGKFVLSPPGARPAAQAHAGQRRRAVGRAEQDNLFTAVRADQARASLPQPAIRRVSPA
jgi:hypothetical protein